MALDGVFLRSVKTELEDKLIGARVDKIYQPSREEVVFQMRGTKGTYKMLVSTGAGTARVHITDTEIDNPKVPPMFCMFLRKHLMSGRLISIRQDGLERILYFDFDSVNEMGDMVRIIVAVEIMGRCSNLILINSQGKIIDSIKRVGEDMSSVRMVLPGMTYSLPPKQDKISIFNYTFEEVKSRLNEYGVLEISKAVMKVLEGISPVFAREIAFYSAKGVEKTIEQSDEEVFDRMAFYLKSVVNSIENKTNHYTVIKQKDGSLKDFCFTDISQYGTHMYTSQCEDACKLLDEFYSKRDLIGRMKQRASDLFKFLVNTSDRIARRNSAQKEELRECADRDYLKMCGDLISANMYRLEKGMDNAKLENFYKDNCPVEMIKLDKRLTPSQNAQKYYNEYRKASIAEKKLAKLIEDGEAELKYIDSVFDALTRATTENEVIELRLELVEQGYLKSSRMKGKPPKIAPPQKYISSDGYTILVGKNNKQNDKLTLKDSSKLDLWCHTHNIPGSHVIVVTNGEDKIPDKTIEEACLLAAYNSKSGNSTQVPVDYTLVRFVKKPVGAKPGMVIFTNNKTAYVTPSEEEIKKITHVKQG